MLHFGNGSPILPYLQRWHWFGKLGKTFFVARGWFVYHELMNSLVRFARCKSLDCRDWSGFELVVQMSD